MSIHNICFCGEIKRSVLFWLKKCHMHFAWRNKKKKCVYFVDKSASSRAMWSVFMSSSRLKLSRGYAAFCGILLFFFYIKL